MKLRIKGDSVRLRLSQSEVTQFAETGRVDETVRFGPTLSERMTYAIERGKVDVMRASYGEGGILVQVPDSIATDWIETDRVGFETNQTIGDGNSLLILVEKDFKCLDPRPDEDQSDAFPNPLEGASRHDACGE